MNYDEYIDILREDFKSKLIEAFEIVDAPKIEKKRRVKSKFGYMLKTDVYVYNTEIHELTVIPWGFNEEFVIDNFNFKHAEYALPDEEEMEKIVNAFWDKRFEYLDNEIAKMKLLNYDVLMGDDFISFATTINDSCVSPKGGCVTHILVKPLVHVGRLEQII